MKSKIESTYQTIQYLAKPVCFASTGWLAKKEGVSERQMYRYLKALQAEGKILIETKRRYCRQKRRFTSMRRIYVVQSTKSQTPSTPTPPSPSKRGSGSKTKDDPAEIARLKRYLAELEDRMEYLKKREEEKNWDYKKELDPEYWEMWNILKKGGISPKGMMKFQRMKEHEKRLIEFGITPKRSKYNYLTRPDVEDNFNF